MTRFRISAVLVLLLFTLALFAPARDIMEAGKITRRHVDPVAGLQLLKLGWLGPFGLNFAWYANPPLCLCVARMLRGRSPGFAMSRFVACLALTALLPFAVYSEQDGWHMALVRGPAVWLWLGAFGLTFAVAHHARHTMPQHLPGTRTSNDPV